MQNHYEQIIRELAPFEPVVIYHFGSSAKGQTHAGSDVDLAFYSRRPADPCKVFDAAQRIAELVGRDVDLVDLHQVGDVLKVQVIHGGRRIFTGDVLAADTFEMLAFSGYARLNEERKEILQKQGFAL